ncbi:MAG: hypothetical protein GY896_05215 [Gammaproteobacteria bacterium]|nr:hypothetical protein [Gammaproteobacteria bacterium]
MDDILHTHKIVLGLCALICFSCVFTAQASAIATITALSPSVWVLQGDAKSELRSDSVLEFGDHIFTNENGKIELQFPSNAVLRLNVNSEVSFPANRQSTSETGGIQPELYFHRGRGCIEFDAVVDGEKIFKLNIGNMTFAEISSYGDICVLREEGSSWIKLRAGSVQITHSIDPNMIVLSRMHTVLRVNDEGSYQFLYPETDDLTIPEIEAAFGATLDGGKDVSSGKVDNGTSREARVEDGAVEDNAVEDSAVEDSAVEDSAVEDSAVEDSAVEDSATGDASQATSDENSDYNYTVYLFSTRSQEIADQVNRKFHKADLDTQIYVSEDVSVTRFRIVMTGFNSRHAAEVFSDSIVGQLGIKDTWIGRSKSK